MEPIKETRVPALVHEVAVRTAQGNREYMEDFALVLQPFGGDALYAAVFDGHSGERVARSAADRLHTILAGSMEREPTADALRSAFRAFDAEVARENAGAVAVVSVLQAESLLIANIGDSQALLVSDGAQEFVTQDHRIGNREEFERVVAAGARVWGPYMCLPNGRAVMTTRAFGDAPFKRIGQISEPAIGSRTLGPGDRWLVLASDGVWDPLAAEVVAAIVRPEPTAEAAAERLLGEALAAGDDNVSVVVVRL